MWEAGEPKRTENPPVHEALMEVLAEDPKVGLTIANVLYGQKKSKVPPKAIPRMIEALKNAELSTGTVVAEAIAAVRGQLKKGKS